MVLTRLTLMTLIVGSLAACETGLGPKGIADGGIDGGLLRDGAANVWIDPDGCQHWYIDDGLEGYMTPRLNRDGTPKCQDTRGEIDLKGGGTIAAEQEPTNPGA